MTQYVDLLIAPEHRLAVLRELDQWEDELGAHYVRSIGHETGSVVIYDFPVGALDRLRKLGIPFQTRPRDPHRPLPVPVGL